MDWFATWFDSEHYRTLYAHRDEAEAAGLIDRLVERLSPSCGAAVLDLGCGTGRHAKCLADRALDVTGIDLSAESIRLARQNERANLRFVRQDMRVPFGIERFECVFSLFTSFGYFDDPADHVTVLHNISTSLQLGGRVVVDYLNVDEAERRLEPAEVLSRDGVEYRISRWATGDHILKRIIIDDRRSAPLEHMERVAKLRLEDFRFLLHVCGLQVEAVYGDYTLAPFDPQASPRLLVVGRKDLTAREIPANAADRFRRDAEVCREHRLRHPLRDRRIHAQELEVALLGGRAQ